MYIYYYRTKNPNFGDDLNAWLWHELLPQPFAADDELVLIGIGTILSSLPARMFPRAQRWATVGSGVGYDPPAQGVGGSSWVTSTVRGPLSAQILGLDASHVGTDSAVLLAALPENAPLPEPQRSGVVFMPHHHAADLEAWREACEAADIEYLDPRWESRALVARIRAARLVLADAMHAAIVADAVRVPWVPLASSAQISSFKWLDWTMSLDVAYHPIPLPPVSHAALLSGMRLGWHGEHHHVESPDPASVVSAVRQRADARGLRANYWVRRASRQATSVVNRADVRLRGRTAETAAYPDDAARALEAASLHAGYLSSDELFDRKLSLMRDKVELLGRELLR